MNAPTKIELPAEAQLVGALAKALPALGAVNKNKANPAFKSHYADLAAVISALAPLADYGLWFRQVPVDCDNGLAIETFYIHESGAEMSAGVTVVPVDRNNAQGHGSAQTYCRRYALMTAFGLAADDDDGNAAAKAAPAAKAKAALVQAISDEQLAQLEALIPAAHLTPAQFNQTFGIPKVSALPADRFDEAVDRLNERLAKLAKAETDAKAKEPADA